MNPEIVDQVRSYLQTIEAVAPPITVAELERASLQAPAVVDEVVEEYPVEPRRLDDSATVKHRRWWVAAVAAAALFAVVSFGLFSDRNGDGDGRPADQSSGPTRVGVDDLTRQIEVVQTWAAAYNRGQLEEYLSHFSPNGVVVGPAYELIWGSPTDRDTVKALMAAGDRLESGPRPLCDPGPFPEPEDGSGDLSCWLARHDRFHAAAVVGWPVEFDPARYWASPIFFTFNDDDKITSIHLGGSPGDDGEFWPAAAGVINGGDPFTETEADEAARPFVSYRTEFMDWLQAAHPDVAAQFGPGVVGALPTADDMPTALEYIPQFIDHAYPRTEVTTAFEAAYDNKVATIEAMLAAYNQGDLEEWLAFFPDGINLDNASGLSIELEQAFMAANGRWTLAFQCDAGRIAFLPFYAVVLGVEAVDDLTRQVARCPTTRVDDFYGAGGIDRQMTFEFLFDAGHLTGYETTGDVVYIEQNGDWFDDHAEFARDFLTWLRDTHPDVAADFNSDGLITAEDMPTALEHVDEFVAQTDAYQL